MSVEIERLVKMHIECDCGEKAYSYMSTRKDCLLDLTVSGWQIKLHRKGESTVVCFECATRAATENAALRNQKAAIRKRRDAAIEESKKELAALKLGEEKET